MNCTWKINGKGMNEPRVWQNGAIDAFRGCHYRGPLTDAINCDQAWVRGGHGADGFRILRFLLLYQQTPDRLE
jgi:hypothetical protein